jgi:hypothetical protein
VSPDEQSPSGKDANLPLAMATRLTQEQQKDERQYGEVDVVLLRIEGARRRAEAAARDLRAAGAEDFLVEALEQTQADLSAAAKKLIQGTFFAVPKQQLTL